MNLETEKHSDGIEREPNQAALGHEGKPDCNLLKEHSGGPRKPDSFFRHRKDWKTVILLENLTF